MKLLKWLAIAILAMLTIVIAVGLSLPRRFQVVRDITIDAAPEEIFAVVSNLREWPIWTVWTGPDPGLGAKQSRTGNSSGSGNLKITKAEPQGGIDYDFDLGGHRSTAGILFFPGPDGTLVAWHTEGDLGFNPINRLTNRRLAQVMGLDLETNLRNLKARVEKAASKAVFPQLPDSAQPATSPAEAAEFSLD